MNQSIFFANWIVILILFLSAQPENQANAKTWNVKDYGVKGDGKTPDRNAIQAVIEKAYQDGGGTVFFPAVHTDKGEYYRIDVPEGEPFYALQMRDKVILEGEGPRSLLKNPSHDLETFGRTHIFIWGTAFPQRWFDARKWQIQDVKGGATEIQLKNPEQSLDFKKGEIIRVSDPRAAVLKVKNLKKGQATEWYGQLFRIMKVREKEGVILLSHDLKMDIQNPIIHKIEDCYDPPLNIKKGFGTWQAGMRNLALESEGKITQRGGAVQCFLENIESKGLSGVLYANACHDCRFKNIREHVANAMEFSDCSVGNVVENVVQEYLPRVTHHTNRPGGWFWAGMLEGSSFNTISNFTYKIGSSSWGQGVIKNATGRNNTWMNGVIQMDKSEDTTILNPGTHYNQKMGPSCYTTLKDIQITCNSPTHYIRILSGKEGSYGHRIENIQINDLGGGPKEEAALLDSEDSIFKNITGGSGNFTLSKSSSGNKIDGCTSFSFQDQGENNIIQK